MRIYSGRDRRTDGRTATFHNMAAIENNNQQYTILESQHTTNILRTVIKQMSP